MQLTLVPALLVLAVTATAAGRGGTQICFGGSCPRGSPGESSETDARSVSVVDILARNAGKDEVAARISFSPEARSTAGTDRCTTPDGAAGSCGHITDRGCREVLARVRGGITRQLLDYLREAIRSPCGFQGRDFTLCCKDETTPSPSPPRRPVTPPPTVRPAIGQCGVVGTKIVGGKEARPGAWPWAVILGARREDGRFQVIARSFPTWLGT